MYRRWRCVLTILAVLLFVGGSVAMATSSFVGGSVPMARNSNSGVTQGLLQDVGACCFADGSCVEMTEEECTAAGGTQWIEGGECGPTASWGSDDFEGYALGSWIAGQGGWETWDSNPSVDAPVVDDFAHSGTQSLKVGGNGWDSDIVHQVDGATSWTWTAQAYVYIPSTQTGDLYFIMLNDYNSGGPYSWSVQLRMSATDGVIEDACFFNPPLTLVTDEWAEIRVDIDLDQDQHSVYYNGTLLYTNAWTACYGGSPEIAAFDLYCSGSSDAYFDDVSLTLTNDPNPCPPPGDEDEDGDEGSDEDDD